MGEKNYVYISRIKELLDLKSDMAQEEITVTDLASFVGVTRQTIHAWMSPAGVKTPPTADKQQRLDDFFDVHWSKMWQLKEVDDDQGQGLDTAQTRLHSVPAWTG